MATTEIVLIVFLFCLLIITLIILFLWWKKSNKSPESFTNVKETMDRIEKDLKDDFIRLNDEQKTSIAKWTEAILKIGNNDIAINNLKTELIKLTDTTNKNQLDNVGKLTNTINKIDENIHNIEKIKTNISDLNNIFYSQKKRGNLGEFSLSSILTNILGENSKIWKPQAKLYVEKNKSEMGTVDALIYTGEGKENIAIDAKFPLDKYLAIEKAITDKSSPESLHAIKKNFIIAIKAKKEEIKKYFNYSNNISNAILFVPSEAIFSYLISENQEIFEEAFKEHVWICSPTTLSAVLYTILQAQRDYELNRNLIKVKTLITSIAHEYELFNNRWENVKKKILDNQKEIEALDVTFSKIKNKQEKLNEYDLETNE